MNLETVIDRLTSLRDNGYVSDAAEVVIRDENLDVAAIDDIDTDGNEVVIQI